jgi:hypothetical protein
LPNIKINKDEIKLAGVTKVLEVQPNTLTPFEVNVRLNQTPYGWEDILQINGIEPFSFYVPDTPVKIIYLPLRNYNLY